MPSKNKAKSSSQTIFIGPFPGPVTGQTVITNKLYELLQNESLAKLNTARGNTSNKLINNIIKAARTIHNVFTIIFMARNSRKMAYLSLDANNGMAISLIYCAALRMMKKNVILHHHTYSHISKNNPHMELIAKLLRKKSIHLCICNKMGNDLKRQYQDIEFKTLNNAFSLPHPKHKTKKYQEREITLGYLGRISREKGAHLAANTAYQLRQQFNGKVNLILAGPARDKQLLEEIRATCSKAEVNLVETGMISGDEINIFYESIDYFLFPTQYENETQGIVNVQAISYGIPSISYARCCVTTDIKNAGTAIETNEDFPNPAADAILAYHRNEKSYYSIRASAESRFIAIKDNCEKEINYLIKSLKSDDISLGAR